MNSIATTICTKLAKLAPEKLVEVYNPGGKVMCRVNTDLSGVELIGNATYQFAGQFEFNFEKGEIVNLEIIKVYSEEVELYAKFLDSCERRTAGLNATLPD